MKKRVASLILNRNLPEVTDKLVDHLKRYDQNETDIFVIEAGSDKDKLSKFNVKKENIKDIWSGSVYENYRKIHLNSKRPELYPCDRCPA